MARHARAGRLEPPKPTRTAPPTKEVAPKRLNVSVWAVLGTGAVLIAILAYALFRGNGTKNNTANGLADPTKLNPSTQLLRVGSMAPNFHLTDPATGMRYSPSTYYGTPIVLEFFATWCPVCHAEAATMTKITSNFAPKGVRVWSILANPYGPAYETSNHLDTSLATKTDLAWFATTYKVAHPQLVDPDFSVTNHYGAAKYPTIYVIDRQGVIRFAGRGHLGYSKFSQAIEQASKA